MSSMSPASTVVGTAAATPTPHAATAAPSPADPALSARTLAGLPPLVPSLPPPGQRVRSQALAGSADALAVAVLGTLCAAERRMVTVLARMRSPPSASPRRPRGSRRASRVALLPDWETLPYDHFSPHQDLVSERLATLYRAARGECDVLVAAATTALYRLAPPSYLAAFTFFLKQGERLDLERLRGQLALAGYQHVTQVVSPGEFSVRGGLIDLFPMGSALPYRIDLFDDDIESHPHLRRRHPAHALPGPRRASPAGARISAGRGWPHALPRPFPRGVRRRPLQVGALQGRLQRHRARRDRVLPAALLRRDRDACRLSAGERRRRATRRRAARPYGISGRTPSRATS